MHAITFPRGFAALLLTAVLLWSSAAEAVMFSLLYDDSNNGMLDLDAVVGTGTVSYDGPLVTGAHAIDSLENFSFGANIAGSLFGDADIQVDGSLTGIVVFALGGGEFGMVFSGAGGTGFMGGSLDADNGSAELSHEPTCGGIAEREGCDGGNGDVNRYLFEGLQLSFNGNYRARLVNVVPEPASLFLLSIGLVAAQRSRFRALCPCPNDRHAPGRKAA